MRVISVTAVLIGILILCLFMSLMVGAVSINYSELWQGIFSSQVDNQSEIIIRTIRLPRVLLAALVGALLAASGTIMQGLFRNPLADPSLIGVTAGASAGGSLMIVLTSGFVGAIGSLWLISFGAFAGGIVSVYIVYTLATRGQTTSVATMLLAGIAITALVSSLTSTLEFLANNDLLRRISLWKMGGLDGADYARVSITFIAALGFFVVVPNFGSALNALLLGESEARHLGFNIEKVKRILIVMVAAVVGVSVAMAGTIAFVGLVVPHIVRLIVGPDHRRLIPLSAIAGSILLLIADTVARFLVSPAELPVGLVTAVIGAPFFISLLMRRFEYGLSGA